MYLVAAAMIVMAVISFKYSKVIFAVELTVSVLFILSLIFMRVRFRLHVSSVLKSAKKILTAENMHSLNEVPLCLAVVGLEGDIVWANSSFTTEVGFGAEVQGDSILKYLYPKTLRQVMGEKGASVQRRDKQFTVYAVKTDSSYVLYFVDDTYFKQIHREYMEKKPVVAIICFDNREELIRDASGGDESRITSEVEDVIRKWASDKMGGFVRKLSGGRYLMISDELHMDGAKSRRFEVLDQVRQIKGSGGMSATISIGIGRGAASAVESESWAKQALEMALGRGGDQVAIMKMGDSYEFFGGLSKGVEKRDKVRTRVIAATLADHIRASDKVFVMGHRNSDLDSVGASVGIWAAVTRGVRKNAFVVVNKAQSLAGPLINSVSAAYPETRVFISPQEALQETTEKTLLIVVDTHSYSFVESPELLDSVGGIVVIDHHRMMVTHIKNSVIFYHEPYASSASEMVAELVQYIDGSAVGSAEAQALLAGIMLDTKNFVLKTGVRTFEASAYLKRRGADTVQVKRYFANTLSTYKEKAQLVASAEVYRSCAVACTEESTSSTRIAAAQAADELLSIQGVRASFVLFLANDEVNISARSLGDVNVQIILEVFGGGGHLTMAGAQIRGVSIEEAKSALLETISDKLSVKKDGQTKNSWQ